MVRLNERKICWIIHEKLRGRGAGEIALIQRVSHRRVEQIWQAYKQAGVPPTLKTPGKPKGEPIRLHEAALILKVYDELKVNALTLEHEFNAPWVTLDETKSPACGCYKTFTSGGASVPIRFTASPGLDVAASMVYDITMRVSTRTSGGFEVASETHAILVTVESLTTTAAGPIGVPIPIPEVPVPQVVVTGVTAAGIVYGSARLYVEYKKRKEGF